MKNLKLTEPVDIIRLPVNDISDEVVERMVEFQREIERMFILTSPLEHIKKQLRRNTTS